MLLSGRLARWLRSRRRRDDGRVWLVCNLVRRIRQQPEAPLQSNARRSAGISHRGDRVVLRFANTREGAGNATHTP